MILDFGVLEVGARGSMDECRFVVMNIHTTASKCSRHIDKQYCSKLSNQQLLRHNSVNSIFLSHIHCIQIPIHRQETT